MRMMGRDPRLRKGWATVEGGSMLVICGFLLEAGRWDQRVLGVVCWLALLLSRTGLKARAGRDIYRARGRPTAASDGEDTAPLRRRQPPPPQPPPPLAGEMMEVELVADREFWQRPRRPGN